MLVSVSRAGFLAGKRGAHRLGVREANALARKVGFGHSALLEAAMATGQAGFEVAWSFMRAELR